MAIEFLQAKMISRAKSARGVPAHVAYRACTAIYDEQEKRTFD